MPSRCADGTTLHPILVSILPECMCALAALPPCQVFVDGGDKYHVESCDPPVQGMDELITQLNTNNDFAAFVRAMRKRFKALV